MYEHKQPRRLVLAMTLKTAILKLDFSRGERCRIKLPETFEILLGFIWLEIPSLLVATGANQIKALPAISIAFDPDLPQRERTLVIAQVGSQIEYDHAKHLLTFQQPGLTPEIVARNPASQIPIMIWEVEDEAETPVEGVPIVDDRPRAVAGEIQR